MIFFFEVLCLGNVGCRAELLTVGLVGWRGSRQSDLDNQYLGFRRRRKGGSDWENYHNVKWTVGNNARSPCHALPWFGYELWISVCMLAGLGIAMDGLMSRLRTVESIMRNRFDLHPFQDCFSSPPLPICSPSSESSSFLLLSPLVLLYTTSLFWTRQEWTY